MKYKLTNTNTGRGTELPRDRVVKVLCRHYSAEKGPRAALCAAIDMCRVDAGETVTLADGWQINMVEDRKQ